MDKAFGLNIVAVDVHWIWVHDRAVCPSAQCQITSTDCHCAITMPLRVSDVRGRACESATSGVAFFAPGRCDTPEPAVDAAPHTSPWFRNEATGETVCGERPLDAKLDQLFRNWCKTYGLW